MRSILAIALLLAAPSTFACGDKLVQIGRGVRYQRANAVRAASILILVDPGLDRQMASRLGHAFTTVGHKVQLVDGASQVATALRDNHYDVILTGSSGAAAVAREVQSSRSPQPTVISVVQRGTQVSENSASSVATLTMPSRQADQIGVIDRAMKAREANSGRAGR